MNKIKCSAPSKLMLLGEYAVLSNRPCLVTAIDKRLYMTVEIIEGLEFQLEAVDVDITGYKKPIDKLAKGDIPKGARFVERAVTNLLGRPEFISGSRFSRKKILKQVQNDNYKNGIRVTTKSEFSTHYGFGSSSAVTVCAIKALSELFNFKLSKKELFDISYKTVLDVQGRASGFDVAACIYGGTLYFVSGEKIIEPINVKEIPLIVGYSGTKGNTVEIINRVKENFSDRESRLEEIYDGIEDSVDQGKEALIKMGWEKFGELMNKNHDYLQELGVSTLKLDDMIRAALNTGAYGAKLSGAGGGDCMIAVASDENRKKVCEAIKNTGGEIINVETGAEGVRIE